MLSMSNTTATFEINTAFYLYLTKLVSSPNCDDCGSDGHFLLAAPGPPEESHKAVARVHLYRGLSDRKKRRAPSCASVGEGLSAHINVINRQYIC